ncbi:MAG: plasmid mobilization protein, partial [Opitutales bacterium]
RRNVSMNYKRKKSPKRLSRSVSFRVNEADYTRMSFQAASLDIRVNELARLKALSERLQMTLKTTHKTDPALISQLIAIGNNLNQMTKRFHITGRVSPYLDPLCAKIEKLIDQAVGEEP